MIEHIVKTDRVEHIFKPDAYDSEIFKKPKDLYEIFGEKKKDKPVYNIKQVNKVDNLKTALTEILPREYMKFDKRNTVIYLTNKLTKKNLVKIEKHWYDFTVYMFNKKEEYKNLTMLQVLNLVKRENITYSIKIK